MAAIRLLVRFPGRVATAALLGLAVGLLGWTTSYFLQAALDRHVTAGLTAAVVAVCAARAGLAIARRLVQLALVRGIERGVASSFVRRAIGASVPPAELLSRLKGLEHLRIALEDRALGVAFDAVVFVIAGVVLFTYSVPLAVLALLGALLPAVVVRFVRSSIQSSFEGTQDVNAGLARRALDAFEGARDLRLFSAEEWRAQSLDAAYDEAQRRRCRHHERLAIIGAATTLLSTFTNIALLHVGSGLLAARSLTPGELVFVYSMAGSMLGPLENLVISWLYFDEADVALRRQAAVERCAYAPPLSADGSIVLDGVTFAYQPGRPVLRDVTLRIAPGDTVAIVGESGAGKSTLLALMAGLIAPDRGRVEVGDGVAALLHEPHVFEGTVRENVGLGRPLDDGAIKTALAAACADFVLAWPGGLDARLGPDLRLSAGQTQRLCLARALSGEPAILLLDEATSNLDGETEQAVWRSLLRGPVERMTVIVTHRLKTCMAADRVVVLDDGRIVQQGTPRDLLAASGRFRVLWDRQVALVAHDKPEGPSVWMPT